MKTRRMMFGLMAVIGAFYYLRIIKLMYFDEPADITPIKPTSDVAWVMGINGMLVLLIGLMPEWLMELCAYAIAQSVE